MRPWCPECLRRVNVVETSTGWKCIACGCEFEKREVDALSQGGAGEMTSEPSLLDAMRPIVRQAFSACRLDFLRWALPQCRTDEQCQMAGAIARAIGEVSFTEAQDAFIRALKDADASPKEPAR